MRRGWLLWLPLGLFAAFLAFAAVGLKKPGDGREVIQSRMIGQPFPQVSLPAAASDRPAFSSADVGRGQLRLVNIFASWCVPCAGEAPQLEALARRGVVIEGVAVRDARPDVDRFLATYGNPYARIGLDATSQLQFKLGSSGVPETFIVDGRGIIRYQHIGAINAPDLDLILARIAEASR